MTAITKMCFEKLDLYKRPTRNLFEWYKRNKLCAFVLSSVLIAELILRIPIYILWLVCFIPSAIFEKADDILRM